MDQPSPPASAFGERTQLAWVRTSLALLAGTAIVARLAAGRAVALAAVTAALGLPAAAWLLVAARRRTRVGSPGGGARTAPDGRLPLGVTGLATLLGLVEVCAIALR